jgi:hypothetical protein
MYRSRGKPCSASVSCIWRHFLSIDRGAVASGLQVNNHHHEVFKVAGTIYRVVTLFLIGIVGRPARPAKPHPISPHSARRRLCAEG